MAKPRARSKDKDEVPEQTAELIRALKFVGMANGEQGRPYDKHVILKDHKAIAANGVLAACHPIPDDIDACPQTELLATALGRCGANVALTVQNSGVTVKSGKFSASIPIMPRDAMLDVNPDPIGGAATDELRTAFEAVSGLVSDNAPRMINACVCLNGPTVVATDSMILIEYWHGLNMPSMVVIPKSAISIVCRSPYPLVGIGYTPGNSMTFYFQNGAWIKTQLYVEPYPDVWRIINKSRQLIPVPLEVFKACATLAPFTETGIFIGKDIVFSGDVSAPTATYEVTGIPEWKYGINPKFLKIIEPLTDFLYLSEDGTMTFNSKQARGLVMGMERR